MITAHQAKGCEFDYVFLPILQDGGEDAFYFSVDRVLKTML